MRGVFSGKDKKGNFIRGISGNKKIYPENDLGYKLVKSGIPDTILLIATS